ncbi:hypothetical protein PsorP6_008882 [Peronosclerospora sorghi]|uniref:Uncharacterized protein n=1 Tax=Peronosclerospora sorghi TaxID=230839 RepID=A0ACC0W0A7_9STRA|nr:hypothetical protein PsorP6_008882 [Peronosclerospora sorghi]
MRKHSPLSQSLLTTVDDNPCTIKVVVHMRPLNKKEMQAKSSVIVNVTRTGVQVVNPALFRDPSFVEAIGAGSNDRLTLTPAIIALANREGGCRTFHFDRCFGRTTVDVDEATQKPTQELIFDDIGCSVIKSASEGFNCTLLAYGQTGSGKTHTMMGDQSVRGNGVIPRLCESLFQAIEARREQETLLLAKRGKSDIKRTLYSVYVSYYEIYNEKVNDLLNTNAPLEKRGPFCTTQTQLSDMDSSPRQTLIVREHPVTGPFVEGPSVCSVTSYADIVEKLLAGDKLRTVASTSMNAMSSRSHSIFTITFTQTTFDATSQCANDKTSKISMIDLAGSEQANTSETTADRLKEGAMINKSLTTLGRVTSALSKQAPDRIPYQDSPLTWLLKESLGGNAKTIMFAMISPSSDNYEETMSTLRYAEFAKKVINRTVVNEDQNTQIISQPRRAIEDLGAQLATKEDSIEKKQLSAGLCVSLMDRESMYARLQDEGDFLQTQQQHVAETTNPDLAIHLSDSLPSLVNISANLVPGEALAYVLVEGTTLFGSDPTPDMVQYEAVNIQHNFGESKAKNDDDDDRTSDANKPKKRRGSCSSTMLRRRKYKSHSAPSTPSGQLSPKKSKFDVAEVTSALSADKRPVMQICKLPGHELSRILPRHARFTCSRAPVTDNDANEYVVVLESLDPTAIVLVNGQPLEYGSGRLTKLHHGDQVRLGKPYCFRVHVPGCALLTPRIAEAVEQQPELKLEKDESREIEALVEEANKICTKWVLSTEFAVGSDENKHGIVIVKKKLEADCCSIVHWDRKMLEMKLQLLREFAASLERVTSSPVDEVSKLEDLHVTEPTIKDVTPRLPSPLPEIERNSLFLNEKLVDENKVHTSEVHLDKPQAHITTSMRLVGYGRIYLAAQFKGMKVPLSVAIYDFSGSFIGKLDTQLEGIAEVEPIVNKRGVFSPKEALNSVSRIRVQLDKMEFDATSFVAASEISITLKETTKTGRTHNKTLQTKDMSSDEVGMPKIFSTSRVQSSPATTGSTVYFVEETFECATTGSKKNRFSTQCSTEEESLLVDVWGYDVNLTRCLASREVDRRASKVTTQQVEFYVSVDVEEREMDGRYHSVAVKPDGSLRLHANRSRRLIVRVTQSDQQPFALTEIVHVRIAAPDAPSVNRTASMSRIMGKTTQRMLPSSRMHSHQPSNTRVGQLVGTMSPLWHVPIFQGEGCVDESSRSLSAILSWERAPESDLESINSAGSRSTYRLAIAFTTCWSKVPIVVSKSLVAKVCGTSVSATQRFTGGLVASSTVWWAKESFSRSYRLGTWYAADVMVDTLPKNGDANPTLAATRINQAVDAHITDLHRLESAMELENVRQKVWMMSNLCVSVGLQDNKTDSMFHEPLTAAKVKLCLDEIFHGLERDVQVFESGPSNSLQLFLGHSTQPDLVVSLDTGKLVDQMSMTDQQDISERPVVMMEKTPSKLTTHIIHFVSEPTQLVGGDLHGGEMSGFLMLSLDSSLDIEMSGAAVAPLDRNTRRPKTPPKVSSHRGPWERQWFVLKRPFLYSYQSFARKQQTGVMDLSLCQLSVSTSSQVPFSFRLVCVDGRKQSAVWWLQASTAAEMRAWLVAIDPLKIEARQSVITALTTAVAPILMA